MPPVFRRTPRSSSPDVLDTARTRCPQPTQTTWTDRSPHPVCPSSRLSTAVCPLLEHDARTPEQHASSTASLAPEEVPS
jgi:hypothetical protein